MYSECFLKFEQKSIDECYESKSFKRYDIGCVLIHSGWWDGGHIKEVQDLIMTIVSMYLV